MQEALGTLNNSSLARQAVDYAYRHGVTVIASAADEAAQHNNWPSSLPHVILVNSVTPGAGAAPRSVLPVVQRLHELQCQDHPGDPLDELLLQRDRPRRRDGRPRLLRRPRRQGEGSPPEPSRHRPLQARQRHPVRDHPERGSPADGHRRGRRHVSRPTTSTSRERPPGDRALLLSHSGARLHGPGWRGERPPGPGRRQPPGPDRAAGAVPELSGAQGARPVLRLRTGEHGAGRSQRSWPTAVATPPRSRILAGGRDHLTRSGTSR